MSEKEGYYEASTYLGSKLGKQKDGSFLKKTACMDINSRKKIAVLDFIKEQNPEIKKDIEVIEDLIIKVGQALWNRDVITDLALKLGKIEKREKAVVFEENDLK